MVGALQHLDEYDLLITGRVRITNILRKFTDLVHFSIVGILIGDTDDLILVEADIEGNKAQIGIEAVLSRIKLRALAFFEIAWRLEVERSSVL